MIETLAAARPAGRRAAWLLVAGLIAAALLYLSLRGIQWQEVGRTLKHARPAGIAGGAALVTVTLFIRALRWHVLLASGGPVEFTAAFWANAAGLFGNNFLPARAGEVVRTVMIASRTPLSNAYVLTTAVAERIGDAVVLAVITTAVLLSIPSPPGWLAHAARPFALVGLIGVVAIGVLPLLGAPGRAALERAPVPHALRARIAGAMDDALRGLRAFHDARRLAAFFVLSISIWCIDAFGTVVVGRALGLEMPLTVAFLLIAALGVASAIPSTPGYVGVYQFVAVTVLTPFGFSRENAIAYILVAQAVTVVVIAVWGSLGLLRYRRPRRERRDRR